ncbi:hypothetical protein L326_05015 [Yersinia pestis 113]|nr:hypothetical protein L327_05050 [Yersinia pestis S3]ERP76940.1 hypothetical protein L328_05035 [Yersinia pestis 24H]ERP77834.1 hypothetical protein L326_05015 [Yersinia pestis 113]ERP83762.1 hypothetical protein L325_04995 [Yersinia pestis 9]KGA55541.1 hypothetical protein DJ56_3618 [Yersinia pestis]
MNGLSLLRRYCNQSSAVINQALQLTKHYD